MAGITGYSFEPEYTKEELAARDDLSLLMTGSDTGTRAVKEWCQCDNCCTMPNPAECVCCRSSELTAGCLNGLSCITEDPRMQSVVFNEDVLSVMFVNMMLDTGKRGRAPDVLDDRLPRRLVTPMNTIHGVDTI